jgi:type III restriction enzyme
MELKNYQRAVLTDLAAFLSEYEAYEVPERAFASYWKGKQFNPGHRYVDNIPGVPSVCIKVPTGGGKTFIACNALKVVRDSIPALIAHPVVWFVPSLSILDQTLLAFRSPDHPYHQKLRALFSGKVVVLEKNDALTGASFDPETVQRQLTILVVSYDSFRSSTKEGRKVYQENASLASFSSQSAKGKPIERADESSLAQVLNSLRPIIIVDESHNAKSTLSLEMIQNLNPSFVLELTATPREGSNIISYVDASKLKSEQMVKLPVIVYNTHDANEVVRTTIDLRRKLEIAARAQQSKGGVYIRPLALVQAEPKNSRSEEADTQTFTKLKEKLVGFGIPARQIAIKTAEIDELKGVDLLSEDCPIRYVLTINALKEGWDCPFAYILASLANRSSAVDVEQIVGRILRQPYVTRSPQQFLNLSYVLTASSRFYETLQHVVAGLNRCGFSEIDCRTMDIVVPPPGGSEPGLDQGQEDFMDTLIPTPVNADSAVAPLPTKALQDIETLAQASMQGSAAESAASEETVLPNMQGVDDIKQMRIEYVEDAKTVTLPSFFIREDAGLFNDEKDDKKPLTRQDLVIGFKLANQDINLDFRATEIELYEVDVRADERGFSRPEYSRMGKERSRQFAELISHLSDFDKKKELFAILHDGLGKFDEIPEKDIRDYLKRVIESQEPARLADMLENPYKYAELLKFKVHTLMMGYAIEAFNKRAADNRLFTQAAWHFPSMIQAAVTIRGLPRSLYSEEAEVNHFELDVAHEIAGLQNVLFWHRNIERKGFFLNGYLNHFPDFIVVTRRKNVILVEAKGDDRNNDDSAKKLKLGQAWEKKAGEMYKYFMVFQSIHVEGAFAQNQFAATVSRL